MPPPAGLSELPRPELEALVLELLGKVSELTRLLAALRDENARLKGLKATPIQDLIKPLNRREFLSLIKKGTNWHRNLQGAIAAPA